MYETILKDSNLKRNEEFDQYFKVYINGHEIYRKYWKGTKPRYGTRVLFAIVPKGGDFGQVVKQTAVIAAVAAIGVALGPGGALAGTTLFGSTTLATVTLTAGAAIGATLLMNSLIPPPNNSQSFGGYNPEGFEDSQMFSISGQSNSARKFNTVPKVYGTHRMFPTIAANYYTSIETDPDNGELVQYFYGIYDFGLGPLVVTDLRIGNTDLKEYAEVQYRLVDPNKPGISEGYWDDQINTTFEIYKGDVTQNSVNVVLSNNENDTGVTVDEYQAVRTSEENGNNNSQEQTVTIAFPQGLITFGSDGSRSSRSVDLRLEFAINGTEDWKNYDDFNEVFDYEVTNGGLPEIFILDRANASEFTLVDTDISPNWTRVGEDVGSDFVLVEGTNGYPNRSYYTITKRYYGILKGVAYNFTIDKQVQVGATFYIAGQEIGDVTTVTPNGSNFDVSLTPSLTTYTLGHSYTRTAVDPAASVPGSETRHVWSTNINSTGSAVTGKGSNNGVVSFTGIQQSPYYGTLKFKPKTNETIKIRLTRVRSYGGSSFQILDSLTWVSLTTRFDINPITTTKRHVFMEIRIKATDQLSGSISNLSGVTTSVLNVYNGTSWEKQVTRNPAWVYVDLLTGEVNKRAISLSRIDETSVKEWADYCDDIPDTPSNVTQYIFSRFECNFILDYSATLSELIQQVTGASQASMNIVDGKYGVFIDQAVITPVQIFSPRNSWGFSSNRKYSEIPDGIKVKYVDAESTWEVREKIAYNDGFTSSNAVNFEEMESFAVTNQEQAFRFGRYMLAQAKLRQENISINVDFEHLICTRGDYVVITQDIMRAGGVPARVKAVSGNTITIDTDFATEPATNYGYTYRSVLDGIVTSTMTITTSNTADVDGSVPAIGDLIVWGEVNQITFDCIVKSITPNEDLTARLTLVEKNNAIFDAESSEIIPDYDPQLSTVQDESITPPGEVENLTVVENSFDCNGAAYVYFVDLGWSAPTGAVYENFEVYVNNGQGFSLADFTTDITYRYIVDEDDLGVEHSFKIIAVSATGSKLSLGEISAVTATPVTKSSPPSDVSALFINITNETLQLDWDLVEDCDITQYSVRYSPSLTAAWESSIPLSSTDKNTSLANVQARTGSYFVKAIDFNGNESSLAASAVTSIPNLFNLNIVEETNDFPTFPGVLDLVSTLGNELVLETQAAGGGSSFEFYPEGNYYYSAFLDLGDVYTVRLQSLIEAEGYTIADLMSNWTTLADVAQLSSAAVSDWGVETFYRGRDIAVTISNWTTLASIDPMSSGEAGAWTDWRKFTIGDFTARIFQFRLKLISNVPTVSPRVFEAKIRSDMPDRVVSFDNLLSSVSGSTVTYDPAFKGPGTTPAIQITQDNASQGDYYTISNKSLESFDITFYDKNECCCS